MITVQDVSVSLGGLSVLTDVSFEIHQPEIVAVMGANGAGKTTLLKVIAGLRNVDSGTVEIDGVAGFAPEDPQTGLFAETVAEEIAFFPRNRGLDVDGRRRKAMAALEVTELRDRDPYSLSVGEQRRVSIAAVLAGAPDVLVLDEPTRGLDGRGEQRLAELLTQLDIPVLLSSHASDFAYDCADRVGVLVDGALRRIDDSGAVLEDASFLESAGIRTPGIVRWARREGIEPPPGDLEAAVAALEPFP